MDEHAGATLRKARKRRGLDVRDVAAALNVPEEVVRALEEGTTAELLVDYVRSYALHVGLDPDTPADGQRPQTLSGRLRRLSPGGSSAPPDPRGASPHPGLDDGRHPPPASPDAPPHPDQHGSRYPLPPPSREPFPDVPGAASASQQGPSRWPTPHRSPPDPGPLDHVEPPGGGGAPPARRSRHSSGSRWRPSRRTVAAAVALFLLGITAVIIGRPGSSNGDEVLFSPDPGQAEPQPEQTPGPRQPSEEVRTPDPVPQGGDQRPDPGEPSEQATPRPEAVTDGDTGGGTNDDGAADDQDGAIGEGLIAQVLNAADDPDAYAEAADELEGLGYEVVRSGAAGRRYDETTVFYNDGLQADAEALRETEPRFAEVRPNDRGLSNDVDLHVVVGRDWAE